MNTGTSPSNIGASPCSHGVSRIVVATSPPRLRRSPSPALLLLAIALAVSPCRARAQAPASAAIGDEHFHLTIGASGRYDIRESAWEDLGPRVSLSGRHVLGEYDPGARFVAGYGSSVTVGDVGETPADFAQRLLLPGRVSIAARAAHERDVASTRVVAPDASLELNEGPWRGDTSSYQLRLSAGLGLLHHGAFFSLDCARALNALGADDRARVLTATGRPCLWATSMSTSAGLRSRPLHLGVFATFAAYLGDSKFH